MVLLQIFLVLVTEKIVRESNRVSSYEYIGVTNSFFLFLHQATHLTRSNGPFLRMIQRLQFERELMVPFQIILVRVVAEKKGRSRKWEREDVCVCHKW